VIDFLLATGLGGTRPVMVEWITGYFQQAGDNLPLPPFLQEQGV